MRRVALVVVAARSALAEVVCGGHSAASCDLCPQGNGAAWCNGECTWLDNECTSGCYGDEQASCGSGCDWIDATGSCRDTLSDSVRTASVHLNYDPPVAQAAFWWQRVEPRDTAEATYFASNGFQYGYGGVQQPTDSLDRAIFSIWDTCDTEHNSCDADDLATTVACGTGVTCTGFGGEGTGRKSQLDAELGAGPYYYVTQAHEVGDRAQFSGYIWSESLGWRFLSRIELKAAADIDGLYSFVEQWVAGEDAARSARYGPTYMSDASDPSTFLQIDEARFSYGTLENHLHVNAWECAQNSIAIATGGDTVQAAASGTVLPYDAAAPPTELVDFAAKVPCLQAAATTDAVEACLAAPAPTTVPTATAPSPSPSPTMSPPDHVDCATLWDPVCGGDGTTYSNACRADAAGVSYVSGPCTQVLKSSFNMTSGAAPRTTSAALAAAVAVLAA
jgi:hypothetical protein